MHRRGGDGVNKKQQHNKIRTRRGKPHFVGREKRTLQNHRSVI